MSKTGRAPTHWRRPITRTYDYNYSVGEHYYTPQLNYLETRRAGRAQTPPSAKTFAERFVEKPIYGRTGDFNWRGTSGSASNAEAESSESANVNVDNRERTLIDRYGSLDDLGLLERRQITEQSLSSSALRESTNVKSTSTTSASVSSSNRKLKFVLGDRLLNAAGVDEQAMSPKTASADAGDPLDIFLARRKERQAARAQAEAKSAQADLVTEDPFKSSRNSAAMKAARQRADQMIEEMNREAENSAAKFRARLKAKAQEEQAREDSDFNVSRADQIRERAKARLAQLESSYPDIAIGSEAVARRAAADEVFGNEFNAARMAGSSSISSKAVKISSRTVRTTIESE